MGDLKNKKNISISGEIPEHVRHGVIAHVVADADTTAEEFDSNVLRLAVVHQNAVLFFGREDQGDVGLRFRLQRRHFNVRPVLDETDARQKLAALACWKPKSPRF